MTENVQIANQNFVLHPSGAALWKEKSTLLIADVHLGKIAHFRKNGLAVPPHIADTNFERLNTVISQLQPKSIYFLGDLFHSYLNAEWFVFEEWVQQTPCDMILVQGNHDIIADHKFEALGIPVKEELEEGPFCFTHHPEDIESAFNICGHIHPAVRMRGGGGQAATLSCFFISENQLILPAFGIFTGKHRLTPTKEDRVYAIVENEVVCVSNTR
ncbi:ligase-associated DNA damage response endonuclease PdeM [Aureisphaera galaxeae]|uniref:ligase-associated DNA damage response endonuclease PdeM n=1 Tax=Aureisphaera galaxeae TaxID=1538023 RepID=UPI00235024AD|nr:ligase-associated DNA damage response endonuclease PdeM [Aureisphaera galaxeae]MDC8006015.1 ligase-associated DNA damage response endonuclease PdeM [Aureisphaera galaxeae]